MTGYYWAGVISSVAFLLGFILLTIHYIPIWLKERKKVKVITEEQHASIKDEVNGGARKEILNKIQTMNAKKIGVLFDGISKLSPGQIAALFGGKMKEDKVDSGDSK